MSGQLFLRFMLFQDLLNERGPAIHSAFRNLFIQALENQAEDTDLLIIGLNGFYMPEIASERTSSGEPVSPYVIGPDVSGHSEHLHYRYIHNYRTKNIYEKTYSEYLEEVKYDPDNPDGRNILIESEELSIQTEMLIYLKVWEMTHFLKGMYQFVRILKGKNYDWHFKLNTGDDNTGTASAQKLIRELVRNEIKQFSEPVYECFEMAYKSQIRNSIAHSNYSFLGRNIHPNNEKPGASYPQIENLTFDEWIDMFHATMIIFNCYIWLKEEITNYYGDVALANGNCLPIRINKEDGSQDWSEVSFRPEFRDWRWYRP